MAIRFSERMFLGFAGSFFTSLRPAGTPPLCRLQYTPSSQVKIRQSAGYEEPVGVLRQSSVAHLREAEDPFDHQKGMLHLGPDLGFRSVPGPFFFGQGSMSATFFCVKSLAWGAC